MLESSAKEFKIAALPKENFIVYLLISSLIGGIPVGVRGGHQLG